MGICFQHDEAAGLATHVSVHPRGHYSCSWPRVSQIQVSTATLKSLLQRCLSTGSTCTSLGGFSHLGGSPMQFPCFPPGVPPSPQYLTTSKENLERWEVGMKGRDRVFICSLDWPWDCGNPSASTSPCVRITDMNYDTKSRSFIPRYFHKIDEIVTRRDCWL